MSKVLSTLYNVGATLVQRCTFNANDLSTILTIFQRWANVIMLSGNRSLTNPAFLTMTYSQVTLYSIAFFLFIELP